MSIVDEVINNNPDKYETIIQSRILGKQLQLKLNQYSSIQREYNRLLEKENNNRKRVNIEIKKQACHDNNSRCSQWKACCPGASGSNKNLTCGPDEWMKKNCQETCDLCKYDRKSLQPSGYWTDLQDVNYQKGMVSNPDESTDDWKFLGKTDNLNDCKLKSIEDKDTVFSSIVYYPSDFGNDWNKSCFGGIKSKMTTQNYQPKTITSVPPNGSTRLGGKEGEILLKRMKRLQDEIRKLSKKVNSDNDGINQSSAMLKDSTSLQTNNLENILERLKKDRFEINKLINEPNYSAKEEDSYLRQTSSYTSYSLWILQVLMLLFTVSYFYSRQSNDIPFYIYLFLSIWIYILGKRIYGPVLSFFSVMWYYISYYLVNPITNVL